MNLLLRFLVSNNHAYTLIEEPSFVEFQKSVSPKLKIISAASMRTRILEIEVNTRAELKEYFQNKNIGIPSATTDLWTSGNHISIMAVTLSWIDDQFMLREIVIGFREVIGSHTGANLCRVFMDILEDFSITKVTNS